MIMAAVHKEDVMTRLATILACSLLFAGPAMAQANQHAAHHPAPAAAPATSPAGQMPMDGPSMMNGDMTAHHKAMYASGGMMAKGGMGAARHRCPRHKAHARHHHCKMHRK